MGLADTVKGILKIGVVTASTQDDGEFPIQQISYLGKTAEATVWPMYGIHFNAPSDYLTLLLSLYGNHEARLSCPTSHAQRPKNLPSGEVVFFHPPTGSKIHFKANGDILIESATAVTVDVPSTTITGDVVINGSLQVDTDLDVTGISTLGIAVTSGGVNISNTHTHTGSPTAPTGGQSNTGVPV